MKLSSAAGFSRRFGVGLRAGADLIALLKAEAKQGSAAHRSALMKLAEAASGGSQLNASMKKQGGFFPPLMVSMTKVGETTGRLERTMLSLAGHYENQLALRRSFIASITLPVLQLTAGFVVISLLIWIMGILSPPTGGPMMDILGLGLRGTRGVMIFWMYVGGFLAFIAACLYGFHRNVAGVQNLIPLLYMVPILGPALQTITLSRFSWTLALALDAGLDPIRGIALALDSTDSDFYRRGTQAAEDAIRSGQTLAGTLQATALFPEDFVGRVEVAELSGTDAESMDGLAKEYDERAKQALKAITRFASGLIWLLMILVMLFFIGRLLMSVLGFYSAALEPI